MRFWTSRSELPGEDLPQLALRNEPERSVVLPITTLLVSPVLMVAETRASATPQYGEVLSSSILEL